MLCDPYVFVLPVSSLFTRKLKFLWIAPFEPLTRLHAPNYKHTCTSRWTHANTQRSVYKQMHISAKCVNTQPDLLSSSWLLWLNWIRGSSFSDLRNVSEVVQLSGLMLMPTHNWLKACLDGIKGLVGMCLGQQSWFWMLTERKLWLSHETHIPLTHSTALAERLYRCMNRLGWPDGWRHT